MSFFILSLLLVSISSYLLISNFIPKKSGVGISYFVLCVFAQVVFSFEILSLFKMIMPLNFLVINLCFLILSCFIFINCGKKFYIPDLLTPFKNMKNAFKLDRILFIIFIGFLFFLVSSFLLNVFMPVISYDALSYHFARVPYWILQKSLNHFVCTDSRMLVMPINSELLYSWIFLFLKKDLFMNFVAYFFYIFTMIILYNFAGFLGFCERKKIWSTLIAGSFMSVILQATSLETDIIIAGLVLCSLFFFFLYFKEKRISLLFFSALSYALAVGTKTTALIIMPSCLLFVLIVGLKF